MRRIFGLVLPLFCAVSVLSACQSVPSASFLLDREDRDQLADRYAESPGEAAISLSYADALTARGQMTQATAVLEQAAIRNPENLQVLAAYGKSLVRVGRNQQAREVLARAHSPDRPDPTILGAEAVAADQMGDHEKAQELYLAALQITPRDAGLLSNYGLSLILTKSLIEAEEQLRLAVAQADASVAARQNLALALALQGKAKEAEQYASRDLDAKETTVFLASFARRKGVVAD